MKLTKGKPVDSQAEKWRKENPNVRHRKPAVLKKVYKRDKQKFVDDYKAQKGCQRCKVKDPRILAFHHLDPDGKDGTISAMIGSRRSLEVIKSEMAKCQVLCHNCHVLTHWEERNKA